MSAIRIEIESGITQTEALQYVAKVIEAGRTSTAPSGAHYCWMTGWKDGTEVIVRQKRTSNSADSFLVRRRVE